MSKTSSSVILLFSLILGFSACEKGYLDQTNKKDLQFGNIVNMKIQYPDTVLMGEYNQGKNYYIDLDQDGQDDFGLSSLIWGSPGMGMIPTSGIHCVHEDAQLLGFYRNDTTFRNYNRREYAGNNIVEVYENFTFTCQRMDEADSVIRVTNDVFKLLKFTQGDTFSSADIFKSDSLKLVSYWTRSFRDVQYIGEDTVVYSQSQYNDDCFTFPQNEIRYIGVKIDGKKPKLGWLKLSVSEYFRVFILEAAIQE